MDIKNITNKIITNKKIIYGLNILIVLLSIPCMFPTFLMLNALSLVADVPMTFLNIIQIGGLILLGTSLLWNFLFSLLAVISFNNQNYKKSAIFTLISLIILIVTIKFIITLMF